MLKALAHAGLIIIVLLMAPKALALLGPRVIYGDDNRLDYYQLTDALWQSRADGTVALMRASNLEDQGMVTRIRTTAYGVGNGLCVSEPFYEQETAAFCSGFLVTPDTIVTAGHCVRTQAACENTRFVFGFRVEQAGVNKREVPTDQVFSCRTLVHSVANPSGEDFAVVQLDRSVTHTAPLSLQMSVRPPVGTGLVVIGHPVGLPVKIAGGASARSVGLEFMTANLDTYGGNSGSGVFNAQTGEVEGILVRGEMDFIYKDGCRMSNKCDDGMCRGEDVTLIERVLPFLSFSAAH